MGVFATVGKYCKVNVLNWQPSLTTRIEIKGLFTAVANPDVASHAAQRSAGDVPSEPPGSGRVSEAGPAYYLDAPSNA